MVLPLVYSGYTDDLTFYQRLVSIFSHHSLMFFLRNIKLLGFSFLEDICTGVNFPLQKLGQFTSYIPQIVTTSIGFEFPRVSLPLTEYVGPLIPPSHPDLPPDMAEWLDERETRSVVYVSMGSVAVLTAAEAKVIINGATQANFSVLWSLRKSNQHILEGMNYERDNVYISEWIPQVSALRHKSIHSAILHGGLGGIQEALSCGGLAQAALQ